MNEQLSQKTGSYLIFKWVALAAILSAETFLLLAGTLLLARFYFIACALLLSLLLTLITELQFRQKTTNLPFLHVVFASDLLLTLVILYQNGGAENPWWFLPAVLIFLAGYVFDLRTAVVYAAVASLSASLIVGLDYYGVIPHYNFFRYPENYWQFWRDSLYLTSLLAGIFLFNFLSAIISGNLNRIMKNNIAETMRLLKESEASRTESEKARKALINLMDDLDRTKGDLEIKVKERTTELELAKSELEAKVKERTADLEESRKAILHMMKNLKDDIAKLQVLDKMKTEFLSMVSHELRTPLTPIKGYLSLLSSGKMGELNEPQRKAIDVLTRQSEHLHALIDSILDLSRIELGKKIPLSKEPLSIRTVVEETVDAMKIQADEKQIAIVTQIEPDLPTIAGDVIKLKRVLSNLVGNSLKFCPEHGTITIRTLKEDSTLRVEVLDNGSGVSADNLARVFEKFYQVDSSVTRAAGGMGMGLPIAKELVELHGGRIWLESDGLGKGTRAIFTLPVL